MSPAAVRATILTLATLAFAIFGAVADAVPSIPIPPP
jgi:hypothetical protein